MNKTNYLIQGSLVELDFNDKWPSSAIVGQSESVPVNKNRKYRFQWWPADTEEKYDMHVRKGKIDKPSGLKISSYKKDDFYYDVNANGFRCDDFDTIDFTKKSVIYLGCSHTFGIGLPEEHCWPLITHKVLNTTETYNYINLSVAGGSVDWYLLFLPFFKKFNPALIISANPFTERMIMIDDFNENEKILRDIVPSDAKDKLNKNFNNVNISKAYYYLLRFQPDYFEYRRKVIFANIESVAKSLNAKFISIDSEVVAKQHFQNSRLARDLSHFSKEHHEVISSIVLNKIKEN